MRLTRNRAFAMRRAADSILGLATPLMVEMCSNVFLSLFLTRRLCLSGVQPQDVSAASTDGIRSPICRSTITITSTAIATTIEVVAYFLTFRYAALRYLIAYNCCHCLQILLVGYKVNGKTEESCAFAPKPLSRYVWSLHQRIESHPHLFTRLSAGTTVHFRLSVAHRQTLECSNPSLSTARRISRFFIVQSLFIMKRRSSGSVISD